MLARYVALTGGVTIVAILSRFLCLLPLWAALRLGQGLGQLWYYILPIRVSEAKRNMARTLGERLSVTEQHRTVRACCTHLALLVIESLRLPLMLKGSPHTSQITIKNKKSLDRALNDKRGVLIVSAHMGNFELVGPALSQQNIPVHIVYREIQSPGIQRFWTKLRTSFGITPLPHKRSGKSIKAALSKGEAVIFAIDQHMPPHRGIVCEFLGQLASTMPSVAKLAYDTGAQIVCVHVERNPCNAAQHTLFIDEPFTLKSPYTSQEENVRHNTERLNAIVEEWVRACPSQWLWHHRRFKVQDNPYQWTIPNKLKHLMAKQNP